LTRTNLVTDLLAHGYTTSILFAARLSTAASRKGWPSLHRISPNPLRPFFMTSLIISSPASSTGRALTTLLNFPSSGSTAGFLGEMLSTGIKAVRFNWMSSPAATELETIVTDWLGKLLNLPETFLFSGGGCRVLQGTTCEAILCTSTAARDKVLNRIGKDQIGRFIVFGSDQTHRGLQNAAQIAGIHPANFRAVTTFKSEALSLMPESLRPTWRITWRLGWCRCFYVRR